MKKTSNIKNDVICPIIVAMAAPVTPSLGTPNKPNMKIGSYTIFTTAPIACDIVGSKVFPVA